MNLLPASQRVEISNLMRLVFLEQTLVQQKTVAGVSSYETEVSWQVWGESDSWFPIQHRKKSANFVPESQWLEIANLIGWFFLKGTLVEPKTVLGVSSDDTEVSWRVWEKADPWFPIKPRKKSANFIPARQRVEISNLMGWFFWKVHWSSKNLWQEFHLMTL